MSSALSSAERRQHVREGADDPVRLVSRSGHAYDAVVVDRSLRGLRIRYDDAAMLPSELMVLSRSAGAIHVAKVVWRTAPYAGLAVASTVDMRTASGPDSARLHMLWREEMAG